MKKLTAILFMCFALVPFVARGATDYTSCKIMVTSKSHFDITNRAQIFQDNPEYKTEFENNKNNPLSSAYNDKYSTGVGCVAKCSAGQKLSDCVTPASHRDDCVDIFAFSMLKSKYEKQWIENKIKKECGEKPAKKDSNAESKTPEKSNTKNNTKTQSKQDNKSQKAADKAADKAKECGAKGKVAKQNNLGIWQCVDSDEAKTTKAQESAKTQAQKEYDADISKIVAAYQKKYQQLSKKSR